MKSNTVQTQSESVPSSAPGKPPRVAGKSCIICGNIRPKFAFPIARGNVYHCSKCDLLMVGDLHATPEGQETLFYESVDKELYRIYFKPFRKQQVHDILVELGAKPGQSLLDVGASYGWTLEVGRDLRLDVQGVEPGNAMYEEALQGKMFRGTLAEFSERSSKKFDFVTVWHVTEHLRDPREAAYQLAHLMHADSRLVLAVPNLYGRFFRIGRFIKAAFGMNGLVDEMFYCHNPNMHFHYFSDGSLEKLLGLAGLKVIEVKFIEAVDWFTIYKRMSNPLKRLFFRLVGPLIHFSRLSRVENLVVIAQRR